MSSASWWQRTLVYLGLKEETEEDLDAPPDAAPAEAGSRPAPVGDAESGGDVIVRPLRPASESAPEPGPAGQRAQARTAVVEVTAFEDAEAVGARYRTGQPVVFDASGADGATARRLVDFVSGMTFLSRGRLSKVGTRAFLLLPDGMELPDDERRRLAGLGYRIPGGER